MFFKKQLLPRMDFDNNLLIWNNNKSPKLKKSNQNKMTIFIHRKNNKNCTQQKSSKITVYTIALKKMNKTNKLKNRQTTLTGQLKY